MKNLLILLFCVLIFACTRIEKTDTHLPASNSNATTANPNLNTSNQTDVVNPNSIKQDAISPEGKPFESLTADSNYFDAVKLVGTPDAETDLPEVHSPIPIILSLYKQNICIVFVNKDNSQQKDFKSNYKYIGTLKIQPSEILHSAKPEYLDTLEIVRTVVIKKLVENTQKEMRKKGK